MQLVELVEGIDTLWYVEVSFWKLFYENMFF